MDPARFTPTRRLIGVVGGLLVPAVFLSGPGDVPGVGAVVLVLLLAGAIWDARRGRRRLDGISCGGAPGLAATAGADAVLFVSLNNANPHGESLRLGMSLPSGLLPERVELGASLPGGVPARAEIPFKAVQRGRYRLDRLHLEVMSPWGLWQVRRGFPLATEVRVYPNLLRERRAATTLFLAQGHPGHRTVRQVGRGREFEKLRDYVPGDAMGDVHWRATARRARLVTKEFQIERTQEVYVILDQSRLSARPAGEGLTVLDRSVNTALLLGLAAQRQGDLFGLVTFGERVRRFVRARGGRGHYGTCRDAIYTAAPLMVEPDFDEMCTVLQLRLRRRALLVFLTSLDNPSLAASFEKNIERLAHRHRIIVPMIRPVEAEPLFGGAPAGNPDEVCQRLAGHLLWHDLFELRGRLERNGVQLRLLESEGLALETLRQYAEMKARQVV